VDAKGGPDEAGKGKAAELAGTGAAEDVATKPAPKAGARPPGRCALKQGFKGVDKCRARAPRPPTKKRPEDPGVDGEINMSSGRSDSDADGAEDNGGGGRFGGSRWRGGKKTRRLKVGEAGEDAVEDQDDHPDTSLSKEVLAALDLPAADVPADLADEVAKAKAEIRGRRLLRPYMEAVPYAGREQRSRVRNRHRGREARGSRPFCLETMYTMEGKKLVLALECYGILPERPQCTKCMQNFDSLRVRHSESDEVFTAAGEVPFPHLRERASWRCSRCETESAIGCEAEVWRDRYTLRQNVALLLLWARPREPSSEELAFDTFLNHESLVSGWLDNIRKVVASVQEVENGRVILGGPGYEVEMDEVCFRARWAVDEEGTEKREWMRYIAAWERGPTGLGKMILEKLETRRVKGAGQGGGGQLTAEELHKFIFRENGIVLLRAGTIVHTDGASAYRDLDWRDGPEAPEYPSAAEQEELLQRPTSWRWETCMEVLQREAAERRDLRKRNAHWAAKYAHLRLLHTSVCHSNEKGGVVRREFVAMRRLRPHPLDAWAYASDPFFRQGATWRKAGTQTVDGYWKNLRRAGSHRGVNTKLGVALENLVRVHQWAQWAGTGADMLGYLGETLRTYRELRDGDVAFTMQAAEREEALGSHARARIQRGKVHLGLRQKRTAAAEKRKTKAQVAAESGVAKRKAKRELERAASAQAAARDSAKRPRHQGVCCEGVTVQVLCGSLV